MKQGIYWRGRFWTIAGGDEGDEQTDSSSTGNGTGQQSGNAQQQNAGDGEKRFTQAELDGIVADRLKREREAAERKADRERQAAEERAASEQGKFKELAEQRQARIAELEPVEAKATRYEAALKKHLDAARKDLPEHITALLDKLPVDEQLDWIAANQDALKTTAGANGATAAINPPPRQNGKTGSADERVAAIEEQMRRKGGFARW